jgi:signal peptidase I
MSRPGRARGERVVTIAVAVLLALVLALAAFSVLGPLVGWRVDAVVSGSMEPAIHTGSVVISRPVAAGEIATGDIIVFRALRGEAVTAHRVVAVTREPAPSFVTKGDANDGPDPNPVAPGQVAGVVILELPYLFYLFALIRTPAGLALTVAVPLLILAASEARDRWPRGDGGR